MKWNPFEPRLPALYDSGVVWPKWPVIWVGGRVMRKHGVPPWPYRRAGQVVDSTGRKDAYLYAWPVVAECIRARRWLSWCYGQFVLWATNHGIMMGEEDGYIREFRLAPIRKWFRGHGWILPEYYNAEIRIERHDDEGNR